jgi:cell division protein FtsI/penicillin-binding protein 2
MKPRIIIAAGILGVGLLVILARLFYWQFVRGEELSYAARQQYRASFTVTSSRGKILSSDSFPLVDNKPVADIVIDPQILNDHSRYEILTDVLPLLTTEASDAAKLQTKQQWEATLKQTGLRWFRLARNVPLTLAEKIKIIGVDGLAVENTVVREYSEASMAAQLLGFVADNANGNPTGYFGLEGYYDRELSGWSGTIKQETDANGQPILLGAYEDQPPGAGKDLTLYLDRGAQFIAETKLSEGVSRYEAQSGTVVIMDPTTGGILAMASFPSYDPAVVSQEDPKLFPNPVVGSSFEPGSVFKPMVMSAALNEHAVTPETICNRCGGPYKVGEYSIRTWNDTYYPNETTTEIIQRSDNVGMTFVGERLGREKLIDYIQRFGFGQMTDIDLQDEATPPLRSARDWYPIDYATASFGQGIAVTPIQLVRAVAAIANGGLLMEPHVVKEIRSPQKTEEIQPKIIRRVISEETATTMTRMMVNAVENGEAKWTALKGIHIAGKTGTAQIPVGGKYEPEKTNASFVGFAPADQPQFVMLVTLHNPQSSPWAAETAAPLWFSIAKSLLGYWGIGNFSGG